MGKSTSLGPQESWLLTGTSNLEPQYSIMLLSEVLIGVLTFWDLEALDQGPLPSLIADRVPLKTLQMLVWTLSSQSDQGSW